MNDPQINETAFDLMNDPKVMQAVQAIMNDPQITQRINELMNGQLSPKEEADDIKEVIEDPEF